MSDRTSNNARNIGLHLPDAPWPDPLPLEPELLPVPDFQIEWLPSPFAEHVAEISDSMQLPPDFAATATLVSIAGAIGRRALVQPKLLNDSWTESIGLAAANVGGVGTLKTPVLLAVTAPIEKIQSEWLAAREADTEIYEQTKTIIDLEQAAWRSKWTEAKKAGTTLPPQPDSTLWLPLQRRLLVVDATMEKLQVILSDNPGGVLCVRDELVGLIEDLNKQGRESERAFWLSLLNGKGSHIVDRMSRASVFIPHLAGSVMGNIIPGRLKFYLSSVLVGGTEDDGFFSRMLMCWPDPRSADDWRYVDRAPDADVGDSIEQVYRTLTRLSATNPMRLRFSAAAQQIFVNWLTHLERNVIRGSDLSPVLVAHYAKYRRILPVVAAIYEMVDRAVAGELTTRIPEEVPYASTMRAPHRAIRLEPDEPPAGTEIAEATLISQDNMERAVATCSYYQAHAARVYASVITPSLRAANSLARHIQHNELRDGFTAREVVRHHWTDLSTMDLVGAAIGHLKDLNWLRSSTTAPTERGGRPSESFSINPKIEVQQ